MATGLLLTGLRARGLELACTVIVYPYVYF